MIQDMRQWKTYINTQQIPNPVKNIFVSLLWTFSLLSTKSHNIWKDTSLSKKERGYCWSLLLSFFLHFLPMSKNHKNHTPRRNVTKEKNTILLWHNWAANQLTFSPFLMKVFLLLFYFSANLQPNYARIKLRFSLLPNYF